MRKIHLKTIGIIIIMLLYFVYPNSKAQDVNWTLEACINYSLNKNIDIQQSSLAIQQYEVNYKQSKYNRLPSLNASVNHNLNWGKEYSSSTNEYGNLNSSSGTTYGINSSMTMFNGFKLKTEIKQAELNLQSGKYSSERVKESVELSILDAYLQILYAREEVSNAEKQIEATTGELTLAEERMEIGIISKSDYLQIKSELASEKLTLANAQSTLTITKVNLMQLMELPVNENFDISSPDIEKQIGITEKPNASEIYQDALGIKPQIKEAELNVQSVLLDEKIAKADLLPNLTLNAATNTGWQSSYEGIQYFNQLSNQISPSFGFNLSIPIFQKNQLKTNIKIAQISAEQAKLNEIETKNSLRKEIEQAVADIITAQTRYDASIEQYEAIKESYLVAAEKYELGIINAIDFLIVKSEMITSESNLLQTKYNLLFCNKILDFYRGNPISL